MNQVSAKDVSSYFAGSAVLEHYEKATEKLGYGIRKKSFFLKLFQIKVVNFWNLVVEQDE